MSSEQESVALELRAPESDAESVSTSSSDCQESRARAFALVGSLISQFPIWGFAMNYGIFQEYYSSAESSFHQGRGSTGVIGTTSNGVMYLSMPPLFALLTIRYARYRRHVALCGAALSCFAFFMSSLSTQVWHLIITQGVVAAFGCALIYSPLTLSLGEWFNNRGRTVAYAVVLACKNIVGSVGPFVFRALLDNLGFRNTVRVWAGILTVTSVLAIWMVPTHPSRIAPDAPHRPRHVPWNFLRHTAIYVHGLAIVLQSAGYGIPQTYLNTYAHEAAKLSQTTATLLLTLFNVPGIFASTFFGYLSDNRYLRVSAPVTTAISGFSSAVSAFLFWGLASQGSMALLVLFSVTFGFFAGGYSATWGGIMNEMEREAADHNEAIDMGIVYGMLNGARGIGYVAGGLAGVPLLQAGNAWPQGRFGYGTSYGPLILFTGLSSMFGGWSLVWKGLRKLRLVKAHIPQLSQTV